MLFNSLPFLFLFLPATLAGYYLILWLGFRKWLFVFLVFASLGFYAVWNPPYVLLLIASVLGNYLFGLWIARGKDRGGATALPLSLGIIANLCVLGWYKYAGFFAENINSVAGTEFTLTGIILPLAISFYTFQQIAYLVDVARGEVSPGGIARYATFVIFFPQLIAGPIVHYREMMPQFFSHNMGRFVGANLMVGLVIFGIGLFKKTVIADTAAGFASPVYDAVAAGDAITFLAAWKAALAYTVQLYFDFSGYSDMAVGLARMFGIRLAANFHSPLKAASIVDYWRRWHMTLQQFIVVYMYQPFVLPLARWAGARGLDKWGSFYVTVVFPTVVVFIVIGLWHGAGWTFVLFGLMHGVYLSVNEFWRARMRKARKKNPPGLGSMVFYHVITLLAVIYANVVFRSLSVSDAFVIWGAMTDITQLGTIFAALPVSRADLFAEPFAFLALAVFIIAALPNTQQLMRRYRPVLDWKRLEATAPPLIHLVWRPTLPWLIWTGIVLFLGIAFILRGQTEFIYFNF